MAFLGNKVAQGGGAFANAGGGTGGVGAGTGGNGSPWVNIQDYLQNAQGNNTTAPKLTDSVSQDLDKEKSDFKTAADSAEGKANDAANLPAFLAGQNQYTDQGQNPAPGTISTPPIGNFVPNDYIKKAGSAYNYNGPQTSDYTSQVNQVKNYLGQQYQQPEQFTYGMGDKAQNDLNYLDPKNQEGFYNSFLPQFYQGSNTGFTPGESALQQNIDRNNANVGQARDSLWTKYQSMPTDFATRESQFNNTPTGIYGKAADRFNQTKNAFKTSLEGQMKNRKTAIDDAVQRENSEREAAGRGESVYGNTFKLGAEGVGPETAPGKPPPLTMLQGDSYNQTQNSGGGGMGKFPTTGGPVTQAPRDGAIFNPTDNPIGMPGVPGPVGTYAPHDWSTPYTSANAYGVDDQRNQYNAILDMLGGAGEHVGQGVDPYAGLHDLMLNRAGTF